MVDSCLPTVLMRVGVTDQQINPDTDQNQEKSFGKLPPDEATLEDKNHDRKACPISGRKGLPRGPGNTPGTHRYGMCGSKRLLHGDAALCPSLADGEPLGSKLAVWRLSITINQWAHLSKYSNAVAPLPRPGS